MCAALGSIHLDRVSRELNVDEHPAVKRHRNCLRAREAFSYVSRIGEKQGKQGKLQGS